MRIGVCQVDSAWEARDSTRARIGELLSRPHGPVDCLVFPEMTLTGFSLDRSKTTCDQADHEAFRGIARDEACTVVYGGVEAGANCLFVADAQGRKATYRKRHCFSYAGEDQAYVAGGETVTVAIGGLCFGLAICYDLRFPYHFWDQAAQCDGFILIANWPVTRRSHWLSLLQARAIENQVLMVGVNRTGRDPALDYGGDSRIFGPSGETLLACDATEGLFLAEVFPETVAKVRTSFPFLLDRKK